ncbi:uncharacterized protein ARMOST_06196 [Armillaria ostoyae]|uniref:Uncharacterized protein n=1 Tax=Armillaria ostoyae TaxID=47428 RepID=A0A284R2D1_ARMOS|nr:uncharacterized protein ARMOST_06196 [Armillaria ostoyae]
MIKDLDIALFPRYILDLRSRSGLARFVIMVRKKDHILPSSICKPRKIFCVSVLIVWDTASSSVIFRRKGNSMRFGYTIAPV